MLKRSISSLVLLAACSTDEPPIDGGVTDDGGTAMDAVTDDRRAPPTDAPPARRDVDVPPYPRNPTLTDVPVNTWVMVQEGGIALEGRTAYSGGAYDRVDHQFLIFGGGHTDGYRNDVLALDVATLTWRDLYPSDPSGAYTCANVSEEQPGMLLSSMLPASRHTYDQIEFIDHLGLLLVWSGPTFSDLWGCPGQTIPDDTWLFDYASNEWRYANAGRGPQPATEAAVGAYDPVSERYFAIDRDAYYEARLWAYDDAMDRWEQLSPAGELPPWGLFYDEVLTTDRHRGQLFRYPYVYDVATNTWSQLSAAGTPPDQYECESYDEAWDVMLVPDGSLMRAYHIEEARWEELTPTGDVPTIESQTYGRFFYDPVDQVHLLVQGNPDEPIVYAYRYR